MKKLSFSVAVSALMLLVVIYTLKNKPPIQLISPLSKQANVLGISQWFPKPANIQSDVPEISAKASLFVETKSGEALYSKNIHEKLPIASLVKVMTVLIALENKQMNDTFLVSKKAASVEPDKMFLVEGEKLNLKELLYGIFLLSANDAAEVLAEGTTGSREEFIKLMNNKAKQLGMNDTYFANPTGFDEDINNSYSTAFDLVILTRYLIRRFPQVVDISQSEHIYLPQTEDHDFYDMYSQINLLTTYPGVVGFKTGYTPEAGLTLITLARKDGLEIIGVLLGSGNRRDEARELLDYSFNKLGN
ncbi:D-alanyl-D-alanine carboxypeptidase [Candidatus Daviesbacteria bacterium]|nr:D-alanyl-D-alanine carboxypeptidase [Candidatus Daviesbacteria bacterium]